MFERFGIFPLEVSREIEGKLLERMEEGATAHEVTTYASQLGVTPPTRQPGWVIGKLNVVGTNNGGDESAVYSGLVWNDPDYSFSREMDRNYSTAEEWSQYT